MSLTRCPWAANDPLLQDYHDKEWGVPEYDSRALWEMLMLEGFQAGLSWITVLRKREAFRQAFHNFDPAAVARMTQPDVTRLLQNAGIIRSRAKIEATIAGAHAFLAIEDFSHFVWNLAGAKPILGGDQSPARNELSSQISQSLKKQGFKFVGPVIVHAWMQAVGMINDHAKTCFRRQTLL